METVVVYSYPYERILVYILSATLAVFLVLAIIICVKVLKLLKHAENIATKAEEVVDNIEDVSQSIKQSLNTFALGNAFSRLGKLFNSRQRDKE